MTGHGNDCRDIVATVILLSYKQKDTVGLAIESLLAQQCPYPWEILVADDGSADGTREICEEYARANPGLMRLLHKAPNKGLVDNYFDAVLAARGKYVADCAGDDEWLDPTRLRRQIEALDADASLSAVCCDVEVLDSRTGHTEINRGSVFRDASLSEACRVSGRQVLHATLDSVNGLPFILSGALFRRKRIAEMLRDHPQWLRCHEGGVEDIPTLCALGTAGDVLHLPFVGYRYHVDGVTLSNNLPYEKEYWFYARVSSLVRMLARHYGVQVCQQMNFFDSKFRYMAWLARMSGDKSLISDLHSRAAEWQLPLPFKARLQLLLLRFMPRKQADGV